MIRLLLLILIIISPVAMLAQDNNSEDNLVIIKYCTDKIKEDPNNYYYYKGRADVELSLNNFDAAISDYSMVIKLNNNHGGAFCNRGIALYEKKLFKLSKQDFLKAIELLKKSSVSYVYLGLIDVSNEDFEDAVVNFTNAIKDSVNFPEAYYNRGLSFSKIGNYNKAIEDFTKVTKLEKNSNAEINIAFNYAKIGQYDMAEEKINTLLQSDSTNAAIYKYKALIFIEKGDRKMACDMFFKAQVKGAINIDSDIEKYCK